MNKYIGVFEPIGDGTKDRGENPFVLALTNDSIIKKKNSMPMSKALETFQTSKISSLDYYRAEKASNNAAAGAAAGMLIAGTAGAVIGGLAASGKTGWYCEFVCGERKVLFRFNTERDKNIFVKWASDLGILKD